MEVTLVLGGLYVGAGVVLGVLCARGEGAAWTLRDWVKCVVFGPMILFEVIVEEAVKARVPK